MKRKKLDLQPLLRFMEILPKNGDLELTLLKCHLLCEEVLTKIISKAFKNPENLKDAKLAFAQKIKLAKAADDISHEPWVWRALELLNQARNELSHSLAATEIDKKVNKFISHVESSTEEVSPGQETDKFSKFHWAVFRTYVVVSAVANFDPASIELTTILESAGNA